MNAEQLTLLPEINEKEVQQIVIKELKDYRALKIQIENKREREKEGVVSLFPSLLQNNRVNEIKVRQMERALDGSLDFIERQIINQKYLNSQEINDLNIYMDLGIKKGKYYQKKRTALYRIATALGII
ncbi:ArpU family phage packaging/lysis transcriptional regulator [Terribacillus sp. 7520-G]|uniref:ArpU family phage packaging/lysis transcriptional regulator n=1 Tax=Terribacillus TaxID=459532 RepID=UPI000BA649EA|nr:ArpU family phage packaging/lysis transcriptional regulator [Terribacillus sp. 7520-G]PAD38628.1 ArpU family transcriptional regulator [Terribacillus sp. 7520-G]